MILMRNDDVNEDDEFEAGCLKRKKESKWFEYAKGRQVRKVSRTCFTYKVIGLELTRTWAMASSQVSSVSQATRRSDSLNS